MLVEKSTRRSFNNRKGSISCFTCKMLSMPKRKNYIPSSVALLHPPISKHSEAFVDGCSAISISKNWILTHGSALKLFTDSYALRKYILDMKLKEITMIPRELVNNFKFGIYHRIKSETNDEASVDCTGTPVAAWKCPFLENSFDTIFNNRYFSKLTDDTDFLRSVFLLVFVDSSPLPPCLKNAENALYRLFSKTVKKLNQGSSVEIVSMPFGNPIFMHSITRGIISNFTGDHECIIMTDAVTFPQSEGSPLYSISLDSREKRQIMGMVIASVDYYHGERVDFTLAANLAPCLQHIIRKEALRYPLITNYVYHEDINGTLYKSVVQIKCGIELSTGILVDKDTGTFLTCSHCIKKAPEREILIKMHGEISWISAKIVYRTLNQLYDVAVLRVDPKKIDPSLQSIQLSRAPIVEGEPVVCVGFQIGTSFQLTISSGVVSKLMDCMLVTTCCIQGGSSGGPIISRKTGKMLGMVVSNAKLSHDNMFFPRLAMSVPVTVLNEPLRQYLFTDNPDVLNAFTCNDPEVQMIWDLHSFLPSKL